MLQGKCSSEAGLSRVLLRGGAAFPLPGRSALCRGLSPVLTRVYMLVEEGQRRPGTGLAGSCEEEDAYLESWGGHG